VFLLLYTSFSNVCLSLLFDWAVDLYDTDACGSYREGEGLLKSMPLLPLHVVFSPQTASRNSSVQSSRNLDQSCPGGRPHVP
jgi:hypothetical protein